MEANVLKERFRFAAMHCSACRGRKSLCGHQALTELLQWLFGDFAQVSQGAFWLAYMHLLLMLCPNTKFLTPSCADVRAGLHTPASGFQAFSMLRSTKRLAAVRALQYASSGTLIS